MFDDSPHKARPLAKKNLWQVSLGLALYRRMGTFCTAPNDGIVFRVGACARNVIPPVGRYRRPGCADDVPVHDGGWQERFIRPYCFSLS